ncbi:MAG TPA: hypothetical protein VHW93_06665 [Acidimicrobiales bacterium]|nr:hypothetical protein [Acidimicrobiales bacterium]
MTSLSWRHLAVVVSATLLAVGGAVTGPAPVSASPSPSASPSVRDQLAGVGHACIAEGSPPPTVRWPSLRNPILGSPRAGVKDEAIVWAGGEWHMVFSEVTDDPSLPGGVRWNVATATSPDMVHWSGVHPWPRQARVTGVASPDITSDPHGGYLVTYQSDPGATPPSHDQSRLFYRTSSNLRTWSKPHRLAWSLAPAASDRMIDGALVSTGHDLLLGFKYSSPTQPDVFELARSTSGRPTGPWQLVGRPDIEVDDGTVENYEFVMAAGQWRLVATSDNLDQPWLFTLAGDPGKAAGWLQWSAGYPLSIPSEAFNSGPGISSVGFEHANSAYLCDATTRPGHFFYLFYAGSDELTQFDGWGHAEIGVARSTDLVHWQVPPG